MLPDRIAPAARHSPQGLRRPRFSFFIFTCQTARSPKTPTPREGCRSIRPAKPEVSTFSRRRLATDDLVGCSITHHREELERHGRVPRPSGDWPKHRRARWPGYRPAPRSMSTLIFKKSSRAEKPAKRGPFACFTKTSRRPWCVTPCRTWATFLRRSEAPVGPLNRNSPAATRH